MSGKLVGEVLDAAPSDLAARAVLVLVAIAENANDDTRTGWPGRDLIARRARCTPRHVDEIIAGLEERGCLQRLGGGHNGQRARYRIPPLHAKGEPQSSPNSVHTCRVCEKPVVRRAKRGPWPIRCPEHLRKGEPQSSPLKGEPQSSAKGEPQSSAKGEPQSSLHPSMNPHESSSARAAADAIRAAVPDATDDEIDVFIARIVRERAPADPARYIAGFQPASIFTAIAAMRTDRERRERASAAEAIEAARLGGPECEHGQPGGASPHPSTGRPLCPLCRAALANGTAR